MKTKEQNKIYNARRKKGFNEKYNLIHHPKRILLKNLRLKLDNNPRKGQCEKCGLKIGDEYINYYGKKTTIKTTNIHHINYHENDPLKDTIELCVPCHNKQRKK